MDTFNKTLMCIGMPFFSEVVLDRLETMNDCNMTIIIKNLILVDVVMSNESYIMFNGVRLPFVSAKPYKLIARGISSNSLDNNFIHNIVFIELVKMYSKPKLSMLVRKWCGKFMTNRPDAKMHDMSPLPESVKDLVGKIVFRKKIMKELDALMLITSIHIKADGLRIVEIIPTNVFNAESIMTMSKHSIHLTNMDCFRNELDDTIHEVNIECFNILKAGIDNFDDGGKKDPKLINRIRIMVGHPPWYE